MLSNGCVYLCLCVCEGMHVYICIYVYQGMRVYNHIVKYRKEDIERQMRETWWLVVITPDSAPLPISTWFLYPLSTPALSAWARIQVLPELGKSFLVFLLECTSGWGLGAEERMKWRSEGFSEYDSVWKRWKVLYVKEGCRQNSRDSEGQVTLKTTKKDVPEVTQKVGLKGFVVFLYFFFFVHGWKSIKPKWAMHHNMCV